MIMSCNKTKKEKTTHLMSKVDVKTIGPALVRRLIAKKNVHPIGTEQNEGSISTPGDNNLK
jgi:NAD-dependent DNA ligase